MIEWVEGAFRALNGWDFDWLPMEWMNDLHTKAKQALLFSVLVNIDEQGKTQGCSGNVGLEERI